MHESGREFSKAQSTVYFDGSFWVCVCERECNRKLQVCKIVFGAEPKDYEVLDYLQEHYYSLNFSAPMPVQLKSGKGARDINPKRLKRLSSREMRQHGISTKAQLALSAARDEHKQMKKKQDRVRKIDKNSHRRVVRMTKRKLKHRGH